MNRYQQSYESRCDFEHASNKLKELIETDRFRISSQMLAGQLQKVRFLPNGRLNLLTVDEGVRTMFHMMQANFIEHPEKNE